MNCLTAAVVENDASLAGHRATESTEKNGNNEFKRNDWRHSYDDSQLKWMSLIEGHAATFGMSYSEAMEGSDLLTERIIGAAIEVHRVLGPGLLESTYEQGLCWELRGAGLKFNRQVMIPLVYKGSSVAAVYRPDLVVADQVMVEIKAVDRLASVHASQLLTYMRHPGIRTGLLVNFNCPRLTDGLKRLSL